MRTSKGAAPPVRYDIVVNGEVRYHVYSQEGAEQVAASMRLRGEKHVNIVPGTGDNNASKT